MRLRFKAVFSGQLPNAERILVRNVNAEMEAQGRRLQKSVRGRVRYFTGRERRGVKWSVSGQGLNKFLLVFGELVQHFIDEFGLPPGTFPPWAVGTMLYRYAVRKSKDGAGRVARRRPRRASHVRTRRPGPRPRGQAIAGVGHGKRARPSGEAPRGRGKRVAEGRATKSARIQARERSARRVSFLIARSIFEHGIRATRPFSETLKANTRSILAGLKGALAKAVREINSPGVR